MFYARILGRRGLGLELIVEIKMYDLTFLSVLEVKGSLLNTLNQTWYPEIDSKCHDEIFRTCKNAACHQVNKKIENYVACPSLL